MKKYDNKGYCPEIQESRRSERNESVDHKVFLLSTGFSLESLIQKNPGLSAQFAFLGIDFSNEAQLRDRREFISQFNMAIQDNRFVLIVDNDPRMQVRDLLAQGFHKPLQRNPVIEKNIAGCSSGFSQIQELDMMIPQGAIPLSQPGCSRAGFVLFYPDTCIAYVPGEPQEALRLLANQLYPRLLRNLYSGAHMEDVPVLEDRIPDIKDYLSKFKRHPKHFTAILGGSDSNPVIRLIAIKPDKNDSQKCCNSFLEDMVCECGKVTPIRGIGRKGISALEKYRRKKGISSTEFPEDAVQLEEAFSHKGQSFHEKKDSPLQQKEDTDDLLALAAVPAPAPYDWKKEQDFTEPKVESSYQGKVFNNTKDIPKEDDTLHKWDEPQLPNPESVPGEAQKPKRKIHQIRVEDLPKPAQTNIQEEPVKRGHSPLIKILLMICILTFLGCAVYLGQYYWKSAQNKSAYQTLREVYDRPTIIPPAGYPSGYDKDLAALWELNNDTVGWISIDGTDLDYPVVQAQDNEKYYRTNFEGEYSEHAVPFVDASVDLKAPSTNTLIYGHNIRADGQMFNILKNYEKVDFYKEHPTVHFHSVYHDNEYKIFSVFYTNTLPEHGSVFPYHEYINANDAQEAQEYIDDVTIRSIINTGVDVKPSDEILTLSTCSYEFKDARFVVAARKMRPGEQASDQVENAVKNPNPLYPDIWYKLFGGSKPDEKMLKSDLAADRASAEIKDLDQLVMNAESILNREEMNLFQEFLDSQTHGALPPKKNSPGNQKPAEEQNDILPEIPQEEAQQPELKPSDKEEDEKPKPSDKEENKQPEFPDKEEVQKPVKPKPEPEPKPEFKPELEQGDEKPEEPWPKPPENIPPKEESQDQLPPEEIPPHEDKPEDKFPPVTPPNNIPPAEDLPLDQLPPVIPPHNIPPTNDIVSPPSSHVPSFGNLSVKWNGKVINDSAQFIVERMVNAEMGSSFEPEALKAQAVAAYTYVCYNNQKGVTPGVVMKDGVSNKVSSAVSSVLGQKIYHNGSVINATYYASNAGRSNDAQSVWGEYFPYLVSVDSPGDIQTKDYGRTKTFSEQEIANCISHYYSIDPYRYRTPEQWFSNPKYINGKYVDSIEVCGRSVSGRNVREKMLGYQIASPAFEVSYFGGQFTFTTYGYGHGVGMSQRGANYYAKQGWSYRDILTHYYSGTSVY